MNDGGGYGGLDWLDSDADADAVLGMLKPYPPERMTPYPVSTLVNSLRNNDPACVERVR